jgi:alpha-glucoside transport system substrate-binding protein
MPIYNRQQRQQLDSLVQDFSAHKLGRREFMQRALIAGLSVSAATSLLAACGSSPNTSSSNVKSTKSIDLLNVWSGEELTSFEAVLAPFEQQNGITVKIETTRDANSTVTTRLLANDPPDIAILPNPGFMQQLAADGHLVQLDSFLDMTTIKQEYSAGWLDLGSYNNHLYALFYDASNKGTIWYSPKQFQAQNYQVPTTWNDLITLSNSIASSGKYPWSMGVYSSGGSSGWSACDWLAQIYLNQNGGSMYDKWVSHQIPWTDPTISQAFETFGQIVNGNHYIAGAPQSILSLDYQSASYLPFKNPPAAYMYYLGDFTEGFITSEFPSAVAGTDFSFFPFPTLNAQYAGAVTGGANVIVALNNTTAVQTLIKYLSTAAAQEIWVKRGGFTATNKSVNLNAYPNAVSQASAKMLADTPLFRFGADDQMPSAVESAFWAATLSYISKPSSLSSILTSMESTAAANYGS